MVSRCLKTAHLRRDFPERQERQTLGRYCEEQERHNGARCRPRPHPHLARHHQLARYREIGNFLKQPSIKKYKLNKKSNFKNSDIVNNHGFFIGLPTSAISDKNIKKLVGAFEKSL